MASRAPVYSSSADMFVPSVLQKSASMRSTPHDAKVSASIAQCPAGLAGPGPLPS